jgi:hypothetical protein
MPRKLVLVLLILNFVLINGQGYDDLLDPLLKTLAKLVKLEASEQDCHYRQVNGGLCRSLGNLLSPCPNFSGEDNKLHAFGWLINRDLGDAVFIGVIDSKIPMECNGLRNYYFFNPLVKQEEVFRLKNLAKNCKTDSYAYQKIQTAYTYINQLR